jgi:hypothetical protein
VLIVTGGEINIVHFAEDTVGSGIKLLKMLSFEISGYECICLKESSVERVFV